MDSQIARFNTKLTNLERLAEGHLLEAHPTLFSKDPSQWHQQRQGLIQDGIRDEMRKAVRHTREDAESIHSTWLANDELKCHLAIARAGDQSSREAIMEEHLYFVLAHNERAKEIDVKPVRFKGSQVNTLPSNFNDVSKSIYQSSNRNHYLLPPGAMDGSGFKICASSRSSLAALDSRQPLSALLQQTQRNRPGFFKTEDKLAVAVGLIEGCYRYLGTPWLS